MGRFKQMDIEQQEQEMLTDSEQDIDFDERNYTDGAWWSLQDAERVEADRKAELIEIERQAEIWTLRSLGAM